MTNDVFKKILIIEDDLIFRQPLGDFLSARSFEVSTADDGEMAMEKLLFHRPHLVILDLLLPKVLGLEVLKRIRNYPDPEISGLPVIILTNLSGPKDMETAEFLKISAYLVKAQTTFEDVYNKIKEILYPNGNAPDPEAIDFSKMSM